MIDDINHTTKKRSGKSTRCNTTYGAAGDGEEQKK